MTRTDPDDPQENQYETHTESRHIPPGSHLNLPPATTRQAPKTFKGQPYELEPFLEAYSQLCLKTDVTSSKNQYKGLLKYCSPTIARTLRGLPSSYEEDFNLLLEELQYFYGEEEGRYDVTSIRKFTRSWRHKDIRSLDMFKRYHREYVELVGQARRHRKISVEDYDRYFWEGLNESLRGRLENRMLVTDSNLDVSIAFPMEKIQKAAVYLLSPCRFDQHLFKSGYESSDTEPEVERTSHRRRKHIGSDSDSDNNEVRPLFRPRPRSPAPKKILLPPRRQQPKQSDDEVAKLVSKMNRLDLSEDQKRHALCLLKDSLIPSKSYNQPVPVIHPHSFDRGNQYRRDPPPHQNRNMSSGPFPGRRDMVCFGCGKSGHLIHNCEDINALIRNGRVARDPISGRLQWPDGSRIIRTQDETWIQAINQDTRQANYAVVEQSPQDIDTVYNYIGAIREEDDASTDEQEDLGWTSGKVVDHQAYSAERTNKVSKDMRKRVQFNPPGVTQGVKEFPKGGKVQRPGWEKTPIQKYANLDRHQAGPPKRLTPLDVNKDKSESKPNDQLMPMQVDQKIVSNLGNDTRQNPPCQSRTNIPKVTDPGPVKGRSSTAIAQEILDLPLTLSVREVVQTSPSVQRELVNVVKANRKPSPPNQEKMGLAGAIASEAHYDELVPSTEAADPIHIGLSQPREDLMKLPVKIGRAQMTGVYDSGSQVNLINKRFLEATGLPWTRDKKSLVRIIAVDGAVTRCEGKIPLANIRVGEGELPTYGDLHVIPNAKFDLLLGRTWSTMNQAATADTSEKSYLSFVSNGIRYHFSVVPPKDKSKYGSNQPAELYLVRTEPAVQEDESSCPAVQDDSDCPAEQEDSDFPTVYAATTEEVSHSDVPDSEPINQENMKHEATGIDGFYNEEPATARRSESFETPSGLEEGEMPEDYSLELGEYDIPTLAQRQQQLSNEREVGKERGSNEQPVPDPNPPQESRERKPENVPASGGTGQKFQVDSELRDSYIRMVQDGISNEEWNTFCAQELRRKERDDQRWNRWSNDTGDYPTRDITTKPETKRRRKQPPPPHRPHPRNPPEESQTLATAPPSEPIETPDEPILKRKHKSVITAGRRSKRSRRITEKAQGAEYQRILKSYQRRERQTRKTVSSYGAPATDSDLHVLLAQVEESEADDELEEPEPPEDREGSEEDKGFELPDGELVEFESMACERYYSPSPHETHQNSPPANGPDVVDPVEEDPADEIDWISSDRTQEPTRETEADEMRQSPDLPIRDPETQPCESPGSTVSWGSMENTGNRARCEEPNQDLPDSAKLGDRAQFPLLSTELSHEIHSEDEGKVSITINQNDEDERHEKAMWKIDRNSIKEADGRSHTSPDSDDPRNEEIDPGIGTEDPVSEDMTDDEDDEAYETADEGLIEMEPPDIHRRYSPAQDGPREKSLPTEEPDPMVWTDEFPTEEESQVSIDRELDLTRPMDYTEETRDSPILDTETRSSCESSRIVSWERRFSNGTRITAHKIDSNVPEDDRRGDAQSPLPTDCSHGVYLGDKWQDSIGSSQDGASEIERIYGDMWEIDIEPVHGADDQPCVEPDDPRIEDIDLESRDQDLPLENPVDYEVEEPEDEERNEGSDASEEIENLRYIPPPPRIPTGIVAAEALYHFAVDEKKGDYYFQARDATLVTEDQNGKPSYYWGDVTIRLKEPDSDRATLNPSFPRTNDARKRIFKLGKYGDPPSIRPLDCRPPPAKRPRIQAYRTREMSQDELEAIIEKLMDEPLESKEDTRAYTIERREDGLVLIRSKAMPDNGLDGMSDPGSSRNELEGMDREDKGVSTETSASESSELTRLGNDPQPSDQAPDREIQDDPRTCFFGLNEVDTDLEIIGEVSGACEQSEQTNVEETEQQEDIKDKVETYQENILSSQFPARNIIATNPETRTSACPHQGQASLTLESKLLTVLPSKRATNSPAPMPSLSKPHEPSNDPAELKEILIEVPDPQERVPGMLAASHVIRLTDTPGPQAETSFFAFGATVVVGEEGRLPSVHTGHAYILLFSSDSVVVENTPRPPPGLEVVASRNNLFPAASGIHPPESSNELQSFLYEESIFPQSARRLNPNAIAFEPAAHQVIITDEDKKTYTIDEAVARLREIATTGPLLKMVTSCEVEPNDNTDLGENQVRAQNRKNQSNDEPIEPSRKMPTCVDPKFLTRALSPLLDKEPPVHSAPPPTPYGTFTRASDPLPDLTYPDDLPELEGIPGFADLSLRGVSTSNPPRFSKPESNDEKALLTLLAELEKLGNAGGYDLVKALADLGILQATYTMGCEVDAGRKLDWTYWKKELMDALEEKYARDNDHNPDCVVSNEPADDPMTTHDEPPPPTTATVSDSDPTDEMSQINFAALAPADLTEWIPDGESVPPYVPKSPNPEDLVEKYVPKSPEPDPLDEIKTRMNELEKTVAASTAEWKMKIKTIQDQMLADECLLTELKWKEAELKKNENQVHANKKRTYKRAKPNPPPRNYETRATTGLMDAKLGDTKKELTAIADRVWRVEGRISSAWQEINKYEIRLKKSEALAPRLDELARQLDSQQKSQSDLNSVFLSELAALKTTTDSLSPAFKSQLSQHTFEIANLQSQVQYLCSFANAIYTTQPLPSSKLPFYGSAYTPTFSNDRKAVAAF